jgi:hypothetical protein
MFGKGVQDSSTGNVPSKTGGIAATGQNVFFGKKATTAQETIVRGHFHGDGGVVEFVDGTQIVQPTASDHIALGLFDSDAHDITGFERDGL